MEGHFFCGELANNQWYKNCQHLLVTDIIDKLKSTDRGSVHSSHSFGSLFQLLVLLSGDVQLHPGPVKFPCAICSRPVASNHRALQCDYCDFWCHIKCVAVPPTKYNELIGSVTSWICPHCGAIQFSDSFFSTSESDLELSNGFSVASEEDVHSEKSVQTVGNENSMHRQKQPSFKILNMNCNSLVSDSKHANLASLPEEHKPGFLCICESKLDSTISDSAVLP